MIGRLHPKNAGLREAATLALGLVITSLSATRPTLDKAADILMILMADEELAIRWRAASGLTKIIPRLDARSNDAACRLRKLADEIVGYLRRYTP